MNKKLIKAVEKQLGTKQKKIKDILQDVVSSGADAGFSGFIYQTETKNFFKKNKKEIIKLAEEMAQELGEDILTMVSNFTCIKKHFTLSEIGKTLYGRETKDDAYSTIANAMAWFALEEVAHYITEKNV